MTLFGFFQRRSSAPVARDRLQVLLAHERTATGRQDLVAVLREEILAAIKKHVALDPSKVRVKMNRSAGMSTLDIDIEIPADGPPLALAS